MTQARKVQPRTREPSTVEESETEEDEDETNLSDEITSSMQEEREQGQHELPEITALKLELSTLATSYTSLQSSLQLQQTQMSELQRVNKELQVRRVLVQAPFLV